MRLVTWQRVDGTRTFTHIRNERRSGYAICGLKIGADAQTAPEGESAGHLSCIRCKGKYAGHGASGISLPGSIKRTV